MKKLLLPLFGLSVGLLFSGALQSAEELEKPIDTEVAAPASETAPDETPPAIVPSGAALTPDLESLPGKKLPDLKIREPEGQGPQTSVPVERPLELIPEATGYGPPTSDLPPPPPTRSGVKRNWIDQTHEDAKRKSAGCMECHTTTDSLSMHESPNVILGCVDCHGGNAKRGLTIEQAHVKPDKPEYWRSSANPVNSTILLNHENPEFIQFVNPGDLRVADKACGLCHGDVVKRVHNSMMAHGGMLWNAAAYNNGAIPNKDVIVGQSYGADGTPLIMEAPFKPTAEETLRYGWLSALVPLPRFNRGMPGNVFRIFEKGGALPLGLGTPSLDEPPGKPERRLSDRGLGTLNRTDPIILGATKTRLHDPMLHFLGSNDRPGDYRSSGCSACHVVYANDRSPTNSGWYHKFGNQGLSFSKDPTIPKDERGHPVKHSFTRAIPSVQCMNCHMHQGNLFVNPFLGYTWWDQETDGEFMYPKKQYDPTDDEMVRLTVQNPEAAAARGLWKDVDFLEKAAELNPVLKHTQFADYHGHGWMFRAVFKQDKKGNRLDLDDKVVPFGDFKNAVHLNDIHLAKGMQCVDCHFEVEVHGNGLLYGEPRASTTIMCIDCHGTAIERPSLVTTGAGGTWDGKSRKTDPVNLATLSTPWKPRFEWEELLDEKGQPMKDARGLAIRRLFQNSTMSPSLRWEVPQTVDVVNPLHPKFNAKARYAKTLRKDGKTWGELPATKEACAKEMAHSNESMDCQICHTSWATSCFGCHLSMKANQRVALNKFEGVMDRNFTTYNPQVVRDDVFQLGIDSTAKKHRMAVIRSSSAVVVGSQNQNREWVYSQAQTVSAEGYSGQAYNPHFPHTTSGKGTTKNCTDCHASASKDNNAWMTSLLGFGTGTVNFFGRYAWAGGEKELFGIVWTEAEEPQAPIGSHFQSVAYPKNYKEHVDGHRQLKTAYEHHAEVINDITVRSEYVYTANGKGGLEVFDIANIDQKGFSERFLTSPVSPLGQKTYVRTKYATAAALPSTLLNDPKRVRLPENQEQPIHPLYGYVFVSDLYEGLVIVDVSVLFNGNPEDNFLKRVRIQDGKGGSASDAFNPEGKLTGAKYAICAGNRVYMTTKRGLAVIDVDRPEQPRLVGELADGFLRNPRSIAIQFQYAFVTDDDGVKVIDISNPIRPRPVRSGVVKLKDAQKLYAARTYLYVANGKEGLAIIDIEKPEHPRLDQMFNAGGEMNDTRAVQIGSVAASMYALVADGHNGFRVVQLISPDTVPGHYGFSPRPAPKLIASYHTHHPLLAVSRGLDRDRVVDETGNQTVVFGRRGARPFHLDEMKPFLQHDDGTPFRVEDVRTRVLEEEKEINGQKVKVQRVALFTKSGKELVDPNPPKLPPAPEPGTVPPPIRPGGARLVPQLDLLDAPPPPQSEPEPSTETPITPPNN